jgi:hypothetical protein
MKSPFWVRTLSITGINAVLNTPELINHGLPKAPDLVFVTLTSNKTTATDVYEEIKASRTDTQLSISSGQGTNAAATADVVCIALRYALLPNNGIPANA